MTNVVKHSDWEIILTEIGEVFPIYKDDLALLCSQPDGAPLGASHVSAILELASVELPDAAFVSLLRGYVFLVSYYFLLDACKDSHQKAHEKEEYLTLLLVLSLKNLSYFLKPVPGADSVFYKTLLPIIRDNVDAVQLEYSLRESPHLVQTEEDRRSIIGRSNIFLLLYFLICLYSSQEINQGIVQLLEDIIYSSQQGDDLIDWRRDYEVANYTRFLRTLMNDAGHLLTEAEVESQMYIKGKYELFYAEVLRMMDKLIHRVETEWPHATTVKRIMLYRRERTYASLVEYINLKLEFVK